MRVVALTCFAIELLVACSVAAPKQGGEPVFTKAPPPPPKPGESISGTMMCTCKSCEPARCCVEEQDAPEVQKCSDGYDFSRCGGMEVKSCDARCFKHRWRIRVDQTCEETPPATCCEGGVVG